MGEKINRDQNRFIEIVKGKIRKDLKKYFKPGKVVLPRKGGGNVAIPVPKIDLPTIRYGKNKGGVGQGPANPGTDLGPVSQEPGEGEDKQAGEGHGQDIYVEFSHEEILEMLAAELPRIQPKGQRMIASEKIKYTEIRKVGPKSLRHHKKTYRKALRRQIASGEYSTDKPQVIPVKEDERFKSWQQIEEPRNNAVIIFMRDISGSVSDEEREIINYICFFSEIWLRN